MKLYVVSNEAQVMDKMDIHLRNFQKEYDLEVIPFGLDDIKDTMSIGPMPISAILMLDSQSIMSFSESSLSSSKSFIIRLMLSDLIRITCNDKNLREKYNIENISPLSETNLDLSVLFDNVRGFLDKSKYNKNIKRTIEENPTKFFMFNNGLTITAEKIDAEQVNAGRKVKLSINNFQVVNGGQTLRTIHIYNSENKDQITKNLSDSEILIRIFETTSDKMLINKIAEYTNSQNAISNTDLKSLSPEQIQIEQFLKDHEIFYDRKTGDTGINDESKWKITMEKFGQILYSIQGSPENAANKKKDIFGELYDDIFLSEKFQIEHSPNFILLYLDVIKKYNELKKEKRYKPMPQKVFYILYLSVRIKFQSLDEYVHVFEEVLKNFEPESKEADSRKIIRQDFKEFLNKKLNIKQ